MKANNLPYTCYEVTTTKALFNKSIVTSVPKINMGKYCAICYYIGEMLKADQFTDKHIEEFVNACKEKPEQDLLDGVACSITVVDEPVTTTTEPVLSGLQQTTTPPQ